MFETSVQNSQGLCHLPKRGTRPPKTVHSTFLPMPLSKTVPDFTKQNSWTHVKRKSSHDSLKLYTQLKIKRIQAYVTMDRATTDQIMAPLHNRSMQKKVNFSSVVAAFRRSPVKTRKVKNKACRVSTTNLEFLPSRTASVVHSFRATSQTMR